MSLSFRIFLVVGAFCALLFMLRKIRKSEIRIADSTFWFLFAISLVLLAVFPQVVYFFSGPLGVESPANFVFLYVMTVLLAREFVSTAEISHLRNKLAALAQEKALERAESVDGKKKNIDDEGLDAPSRKR